MIDLKNLREEFSKLHADTTAVITAAAKDGRAITAEETESNKQRYARMDQIQAIVEENNRLAKYAFSADEVEHPAAPSGKEEFEAARNAEQGGAMKFDAVKYKEAVTHFARSGDLSKCQKFALTTGTQTGAMLPKQVLQPVAVRRNYNAIRNVIAQYGLQPISIDRPVQISLPVSDDSGNVGAQQAEGATSGTTADPSYANSIVLNPTLYSSKQLWVSNTQLEAVDFDFFAYALPVLQKRIDKEQESVFTTTLLTATTGKVTASGAAVTYAELLAWESSLPVAYRTDAAFILSDSLYQLVRGLVDNNNRPIFDLDPTNVFQGRLHGKPIAVSDYMQTVASGHKSGAFVSAEALKVMDVNNARVTRYINVPSNPDQTGFEMFQNGDFGFDPNGVRLIAHT